MKKFSATAVVGETYEGGADSLDELSLNDVQPSFEMLKRQVSPTKILGESNVNTQSFRVRYA